MRLRFRSLSLRMQAMLAVIAIVLAMSAAHALLVVPYLRSVAEASEAERLHLQARALARQIGDALSEVVNEVDAISKLPAVRSLDRARIDPILAVLEQSLPTILHIQVQDARGIVISRPSKPERVGDDRGARLYFTVPRDTGRPAAESEPRVSEAGNNSLGLSAPIFGDDGAFLGVVMASIGLDDRNAHLYTPVTRPLVPAGYRVQLVTPAGRVLAGSPSGAQAVDPALLRARGFVATHVDGQEVHSAVEPVAETDWRAIVSVDAALVRGDVDRIVQRYAAVIGGICLAVIAAAFALVSGVTSPLAALRAGLREFATSGTALPLKARGSSDVATLVDAFNDMLAERRRAQEGRARAEEQFRAVCESSPSGILLLGEDRGCVYANPRWQDLTGQGLDLCRARGWLDALEPESRARAEDLLFSQAGRDTGLDVRTMHERWLHLALSEFVGDGSARGFVLTAIDLTERMRGEADLRAATAAAERASQAKSVFLANMSHEIRTPLTAVLGYSDLLVGRLNATPEDARRWAEVIRRNGESLLALVNEILDLSRLDADQLRLAPAPLDLDLELAHALATVRPQAEAKGLALTLQIVEDAPRRIVSDSLRLRQVLVNVLSNAVKFTPSGGVHAEARGATVDGRAMLAISVRDTGVGVRDGDAERIFQPFEQADSSLSRHAGGTGLGLPLARRIARALGGDVVLQESTCERGSVFTVTVAAQLAPPSLTLPSRPPSAASPESGDPLGGLRILLVEDQTDLRELTSRNLRAFGAQVSTAVDGVDGLRLAEATAFDVVLMDLQMPRMDGYEATRELRQRGFRQPIIALTAFGMLGERERCVAAGCDDLLTKPVNTLVLLRCLQGAASRHSDRNERNPHT